MFSAEYKNRCLPLRTGELKSKSMLTLLLPVLLFWAVNCVSPYYGTARIEPGWHMDAGLCGGVELEESADTVISGFLARGDFAVQYGFNSWIQLHSRVAGIGFSRFQLNPWGEAALGANLAMPFEAICPGIQLEVGFMPQISTTLLLGIGKPEWLTIGWRFRYFIGELGDWGYFPNLFITGHLGKWILFSGIGRWKSKGCDWENYWHLNVGIGYNIK